MEGALRAALDGDSPGRGEAALGGEVEVHHAVLGEKGQNFRRKFVVRLGA